MNASGVTLALLGVLVIAQVVKGGALQRLGVIGCPGGSSGGNGKSGSTGGGGTSMGSGGASLPPRF